MSRFYDLLLALLPEIAVRGEFAWISYSDYRRNVDSWSTRQRQHDPTAQLPEPLAARDDLTRVYTLYGLSLLWQDRYLHIPFREMYSAWHLRHHWYAETTEALRERIQQPQQVLLCIDAGLRPLHALAAARGETLSERERDDYQRTRHFFGRAFSPLLLAHALLDDEGHEVQQPAIAPPGSTLFVSDLTRITKQSLGIDGYRARLRKRQRAQAPERCDISLATYTQQEREQVASTLVSGSQEAAKLPIRLVLSEIALRGQLSEGTYQLQREENGV